MKTKEQKQLDKELKEIEIQSLMNELICYSPTKPRSTLSKLIKTIGVNKLLEGIQEVEDLAAMKKDIMLMSPTKIIRGNYIIEFNGGLRIKVESKIFNYLKKSYAVEQYKCKLR